MPRDSGRVQQRGEVVRLPEATWRLLDLMHASGWFTGPGGAGVIRHIVFDGVTKWLEGKDWRTKTKDLFPKTEDSVSDEATANETAPPAEKPKRKIGRHERMDDIYGEICNIGEELSGWQQPVTEEDRAEIRKMANDLLALMDEHEKLDTP